MQEMYCVISGNVQGVGYRSYVQEAALLLGVTGWIANTHDAAVELVAQGLPEDLKQLVEYLHEGSLLSRVDVVAIDWRTATIVYDDFSIRYV